MLLSNNDPFVKMKNPYTFGVPVRGENFFGRKAELQVILDTLENVPRGQKQDMAILGPRRIGKSSLLYRVVDLLTPHNEFVPVYVDLQNIKPRKIQTLFYKILTEIRAGYKQNSPQVDLPPFQTLESTTIPPDLEFFTFDQDLTTLNDFIANEKLRPVKKPWLSFWSRITQKGEKPVFDSPLPRLVLIFDEVELLEKFGGQDMLAWFRSLIQSMPYIIFVVAGSERLYSLTQDYGSPFFNIFKILELHSLTSQEAKNLLQVPATQIGMDISPDEIDKIVHYVGNNPYFIQGIGHYLVERLNSRKRRQVDRQDVNSVIKKSVKYLSGQLAYLWSVTSEIQKVMLYVLAQSGRPQPISCVVSSIAEWKEVIQSESEQQEIFDDLVQQQILKRKQKDYYWFIAPLFVDWILSEVDDEEIIKLATSSFANQRLNVGAMTKLLIKEVNDLEIDRLVEHYFPRVSRELSLGMVKPKKINLLLDYVKQNPRESNRLISILRREYPREYARFENLIYN